MTALLHPLAVMNISDHFSRTKAAQATDEAKAGCRVMGCLIGTQQDGVTEIFNAFEVVFTAGDGMVEPEYLAKKQAYCDSPHHTDTQLTCTFQLRRNSLSVCLMCTLNHTSFTPVAVKQTFFEYDVVGWYATGEENAPSDAANHQRVSEVCSAPHLLYIRLDTRTDRSFAGLPFSAYSMAAGGTFDPVEVKVEASGAEKIGIDHISRVLPSGGSASMQITTHLGGLHGAVAKLHENTLAISDYLKAVQSGAAPKDHNILRQAGLMQEYNDVLLTAYLASLTKNANQANSLVDKFSVVSDKHRRHRGMGF